MKTHHDSASETLQQVQQLPPILQVGKHILDRRLPRLIRQNNTIGKFSLHICSPNQVWQLQWVSEAAAKKELSWCFCRKQSKHKSITYSILSWIKWWVFTETVTVRICTARDSGLKSLERAWNLHCFQNGTEIGSSATQFKTQKSHGTFFFIRCRLIIWRLT